MMHEVRIERRESIPLAIVRRRASPGQLSGVVPEGCGRVWTVLKEHGVQGAGRHVALYLNGRIDLEVGVEIGGAFSGAAEVARSATPAGEVAFVQHRGPYQRLHEAHEAIRQWCTNHGHAFAGPSWEIYDHWKSEWDHDPSQIGTEVVYLLRE